MEIRFHKRVQSDLNAILRNYQEVSERLADDFFAEFQMAVKQVAANPERFHFDRSGLRRCNLARFPYHLLYDVRREHIRVWVLRYNRRDPNRGLSRF